MINILVFLYIIYGGEIICNLYVMRFALCVGTVHFSDNLVWPEI